MKIRVEADGTVEIDLNGSGDAKEAVRLIRQIQGATDVGPTPAARSAAALTPSQAETYNFLRGYPDGCHYAVAAAELGLSAAAANSRMWYLSQLGYAERIRSGVYKVVA